MDQNNKMGKLLPPNPDVGPSTIVQSEEVTESSTNNKTSPKPETTKDNLQYSDK